MQRLNNEIIKVANADIDLTLLEGESGTGKDRIAFEIHSRSKRRHKSFISLNLSGISESLILSELFGHKKGAFTGAFDNKDGIIRQAEGGTLYLPEISSLDKSTQLILLEFFQFKNYRMVGDNMSKSADVRIIMATNHNLMKLVNEKIIREDFYYRINAYKLNIPPLIPIRLIQESCTRLMMRAKDG
jgi:transcriptional regulator with PAS, ATPase and Fis domain